MCRRGPAASGPQALFVGRESDDRGSDLVEHALDRLLDALPAVAASAVAQFDRLVFTGGRTGGTAARATVPSMRATSTSTVGLPRESRISRAATCSMMGTVLLLAERDG